MTLNQLVIALIINGFTLITIVLGWDGTKYITKATSETNRTLLDFGKYTTSHN
jgi:putative Mn2+ efflux pump MntP